MSAAAPTPRDVRQLIAGATGQLSGKRRGPDRKVRRESYDVDDSRAQVFARIGDGSRATGLGWIDDLVQLAEEYDLHNRKPGERGPLQASGVRVLKIMLRKFLDFSSGQLDPAVRGIATATGYTYKTVHAALKRLKAHGFLDWVRRSRATDRAIESEGEAGPQREQVSNAYFFPFRDLPKAVAQRWRDLRENRRRRLAAKVDGRTAEPNPAPAPSNPALQRALGRLDAALGGANPSMGEYPCSGVQG